MSNYRDLAKVEDGTKDINNILSADYYSQLVKNSNKKNTKNKKISKINKANQKKLEALFKRQIINSISMESFWTEHVQPKISKTSYHSDIILEIRSLIDNKSRDTEPGPLWDLYKLLHSKIDIRYDTEWNLLLLGSKIPETKMLEKRLQKFARSIGFSVTLKPQEYSKFNLLLKINSRMSFLDKIIRGCEVLYNLITRKFLK